MGSLGTVLAMLSYAYPVLPDLAIHFCFIHTFTYVLWCPFQVVPLLCVGVIKNNWCMSYFIFLMVTIKEQ